jgi:hypothetical protein
VPRAILPLGRAALHNPAAASATTAAATAVLLVPDPRSLPGARECDTLHLERDDAHVCTAATAAATSAATSLQHIRDERDVPGVTHLHSRAGVRPHQMPLGPLHLESADSKRRWRLRR